MLGIKTPLTNLRVRHLAYAALVWSLQDWSPEYFVDALIEQKSVVLERFGGLEEANLSDEEIGQLQTELRSLMYASRIAEFQMAVGHLYILLFDSNNL